MRGQAIPESLASTMGGIPAFSQELLFECESEDACDVWANVWSQTLGAVVTTDQRSATCN